MSTSTNIGVVGSGPRGLSVLERLSARVAKGEDRNARVTVHLIDAHPAGAGAVWREDQSAHLLMNTVASQVTAFADSTVGRDVPVLRGPSLYEWARSSPQARTGALRPDDYAPRALYGRYLRWALQYIVGRVPDGMTVRIHQDRAVRLFEDAAGQGLELAGGTVLTGLDAVVLAQGHVPMAPTEAETELGLYAESNGLRYVGPANPADVDLSQIAPGTPVLLRGLGLNFFDYMALFTAGRGGSFVTGPHGRLRYRPSGREPVLHAGSRRGVPYHARGENEKGAHGMHEPLLLTPAVIRRLRRRAAEHGDVTFRRDVWPLVAKEVETVYYCALLGKRGLSAADVRGFRRRFPATERGGAAEDALLDAHGIGVRARWDWQRIAEPYRDLAFDGPDAYGLWAQEYLRRDADRARGGNVCDPVKAAVDVLRDLRNAVRQIVDHAGITGRSYRDELRGWYTPLNAFLSIGPPGRRTEEAVALMEAGVLRLVGPRLEVTPDAAGRGFLARSSVVPGEPVLAGALIEARLPGTDVRRTADPLLRDLLAHGQATSFTVPEADGPAYNTGALAVTGRPGRLVTAGGRAHPRRFVLGVPTEGVHWVTAAGIRPCVGSVTLEDSDAIASALLGLGAARRRQPGRTREGSTA
ncbi:FAD/NAD(P)-binding protein [Streptomyces sp. NPDC053427]|uniref:FAD/NAD(P)-binding protein n=1 Tax=Streptomyces sp. NPDC053427 TaxID=3365701 RepID=UPI0037CCFCBB